MKAIVACLFCVILKVESGIDETENVTYEKENVIYQNATYQPAQRQLLDFSQANPVPIGLWTKSSGEPTEIRDMLTINSDQFNNQLLLDSMLQFDRERIPERVVTAKGTGAFGFFEVTNDVSKYTYADVFNGIGKTTQVVVRFSTALQNKGGSDLARDLKTMAIKFYTKQGNLDILCLQTPVFLFRDPILFRDQAHSFLRNPKTNLYDFTSQWDFVTQRPDLTHTFFWILSDYGIPDGYRKMDGFAIQTFELSNENGETYYVRFNFRSEQGFSYLTSAQAAMIQGTDPDYYTRDLYNAIEQGNYPVWKLEMDVMTREDIQKVDYDPFDVTRLWKNGTFFTVPIGRLVLNKNPENQFRDIEQAAFNPSNLVPGIPGPADFLFRGRRLFYRDTQNYRLGVNLNKITVNMPLYANTYNRDGKPPTRLNGQDAPNYYPNSFNGPVPYVDEKRPKQKLQVFESNAVDLEPSSYFYNHIIESEAHRQRFVSNIAMSLVPVTPPVLQRAMQLLYLVDRDLASRVRVAYEVALAQAMAMQAAAQATPPPEFRNIPSAEEAPKDKPVKSVYGKGKYP